MTSALFTVHLHCSEDERMADRSTRSSHKEGDNNGNSSSSSDDETAPKYKKSYGANVNANFNAFMVRRC